MVGPTSVPQVFPPLLLPPPLLLLPPLLPLPPLLVLPPVLPEPPLLLPPPMPHTPPRETQALTCCPALVTTMVQASSALQAAPPAHDAAQYESLAICTQYPLPQSLSERQAVHVPPLPDELPLPVPGLPLLLWPVLVPPSSPPNAVSSVVDVPVHPASEKHALRLVTRAAGTRNRDVCDMIGSAGKNPRQCRHSHLA